MYIGFGWTWPPHSVAEALSKILGCSAPCMSNGSTEGITEESRVLFLLTKYYLKVEKL